MNPNVSVIRIKLDAFILRISGNKQYLVNFLK